MNDILSCCQINIKGNHRGLVVAWPPMAHGSAPASGTVFGIVCVCAREIN